MQRFSGKVAVITGGNSGIGLATACRLKEEGATVAIIGRDAHTLSEAGRQFGFVTIQADVACLDDIDRMYAEVSSKVGKVDVLFANAGIYKTMPVSDTTEAFFDEMMDVNLKGLFFTVQRALPCLNDGAAVVLNSSMVTSKGWSGSAVYGATKAAVRSLARTLSTELLPRRIRVNVVSPGVTFTPVFARMGLSADAIEEMTASLSKMVPAGRLGTAEDIAAGVAYLASADAAYVVGFELTIDGGISQL